MTEGANRVHRTAQALADSLNRNVLKEQEENKSSTNKPTSLMLMRKALLAALDVLIKIPEYTLRLLLIIAMILLLAMIGKAIHLFFENPQHFFRVYFIP